MEALAAFSCAALALVIGLAVCWVSDYYEKAKDTYAELNKRKHWR